MTAALLGLGAFRPDRILTNAEISTRVDTSDEWIVERTGIRERRIAGPDDSVVSMATYAAGKALASAGVDSDEVDLLLLATCSSPTPLPGGAAQVAHALGLASGAADLNAGCAGFCYALSVAADAVSSGNARHVVVVASERLSDWVDWTDRGTCVLFGDGAGAAVVGPGTGIGPVVWGSDGSRHASLAVPVGSRHVQMDGPAVFRWATTSLADAALAACDRAGVTPGELDWFVPHQANQRIVDILARKIGVDPDRVADDVALSGNTSAASVPLALTALMSAGRATSGDLALLLGFGAGLTYAAQVVTLP
ncbi:MAG TPA: beta-ketoacyl-ACP synthase III [Mycobacteriales bacterium]|nr:beta-ketoacyl-ACP synthase III [Mycobacteriales bacterium]